MTFTAEAVDRLVGPEWLQARRRAAIDRFSTLELPTAAEEVWRYSRVAELDLDRFALLSPDGDVDPDLPPELRPVLDAIGPRAALVLVRNGRLASVEVDDGLAAKGLAIGPAADLDPAGDAVGSVAGPAGDAFGELNDALAPDPLLVRTPPGLHVADPVVVLHWTDADATATFPRLVVQAGDDSDVTVVDHQGSADVDALVVPVVELDAGPAARLRYCSTQLLGPRVWQLARQASRVGQEASLTTTTVALGGGYARVSSDSTMAGRGGSGELLAVYFGEGDQLHDFRTGQDHVAPSTTSNLLFKGALQGRARAVYTGLIHIGREAAGVNAFQTNRTVKLSADAWAESVPNLEIENNDVRCSHASAVGPVDEDQRFYLESRGVPPVVAERLIVLGFFEEVLERLPVLGLAAPLRAEVAAKLDRRDAAEVLEAVGVGPTSDADPTADPGFWPTEGARQTVAETHDGGTP